MICKKSKIWLNINLNILECKLQWFWSNIKISIYINLNILECKSLKTALFDESSDNINLNILECKWEFKRSRFAYSCILI